MADPDTPMFRKVAFTLYPVKDAQRARAFYEQTLGLKRTEPSGSLSWTEYDLPGGGCLALFQTESLKPTAGAGSIAFEVEDLDALNTRLKAAGVTYTTDVIHGPNCRMSNILDSEGNPIILHQLNSR
jgi:predicted enzyme related to lactoylglutathione lyase